MTEFNSSDAEPLGVGDGCVLPRDRKQVCIALGGVLFLSPTFLFFPADVQRSYSGGNGAAVSVSATMTCSPCMISVTFFG